MFSIACFLLPCGPSEVGRSVERLDCGLERATDEVSLSLTSTYWEQPALQNHCPWGGPGMIIGALDQQN